MISVHSHNRNRLTANIKKFGQRTLNTLGKGLKVSTAYTVEQNGIVRIFTK
ncbi:hypothetical protein [Desulfopila sp. IMCC35008]|uniref:hypothetical protein n=1 Tax=Desulfopila sp. IMCC35008 TaxID=2653858 RepID=UPI0013D20B97|nr:hypothetical protein [Desulfopila sp. IMCC35008]